MDSLVQDLHFFSDVRFGARSLVKSPLTTAAAILSLALGIGGTTAMFSAVDAVLLRPLPYPQSDRLVLVSASSELSRGAPAARRGGDLSPGDFLDYRRSISFEGLASVSGGSMRLTGDGPPEQIRTSQVSGNFFTLLGAKAIAGRTFAPADDAAGAPSQAVLSEQIWRRRYGGRGDVIGRPITVSDQQVEVVGVVPRSFRFETESDVWILGNGGVPRFSSIPNLAQNRDVHILTVVGRLREGVSIQAAQAELDGIAARLAGEQPIDVGWGIALDPLKSALVGDTRRVLVLLLVTVALMLLIASVNVANLMMVRTEARTLELAMRTALGASPLRLARQILVESLLLAACGGLLGIALAAWGVHALVQLAPAGLPRVDEIAVNGRLAAFATLVTASVGLGFGLWPAWRASRAPLTAAIAAGTRQTVGRDRRRSQLVLVSSELAVAQVLLVGAGLLLASFARLVSVSPGFNPRNLVAVDVSLPGAKYREPAQRIRFHEGILERLRSTPGIDRAAMAMRAPMTPAITRGVWIDGRPALRPGELQTMSFLTVSDDYFSATGMRLLRGRAVAREDDSRSVDVVVVNDAFADRYFSAQDPIGKRIGYGPRGDPHYWRTVVGIVADSRDRLAEFPQPTAYAPFRQDREPWNFGSYLVKSSLPVTAVGDIVRRAVFASDADEPVSRVRAVEDDMRESIATERFTTLVATLFAGLALVLAVVGTFGVMSHIVRGRTREIGVRMALGATRLGIVTLVVGQAARIVLVATVTGLGAAAVLGASIRALLYEVQPRDTSTMVLTAGVLISTALAASYLPLRRVLAQNPLASLRTE
jgi:putative ABC transport system permease protein